jgi:hypothetical protein
LLVVVDPKETEDRARAPSHETGLIIVLDYNTATYTTVGIGKKYMADLYPTETGNMVMHSTARHDFAKCEYDKRIYSCDLFTVEVFMPNKLVNLVWKEGFTMQGMLRGVHPLKMNLK